MHTYQQLVPFQLNLKMASTSRFDKRYQPIDVDFPQEPVLKVQYDYSTRFPST